MQVGPGFLRLPGPGLFTREFVTDTSRSLRNRLLYNEYQLDRELRNGVIKMKIVLIMSLFLCLSSSANAALINAGDTYSYSFDRLYYTQEAKENFFYDMVSLEFYQVFDINLRGPVPYDVEIRLYEGIDPNSTPFYTTSFSEPIILAGIFGFNWPANTWSDHDGLVEVEVTTGSIFLNSIEVTLDLNNKVYTSIQPVPLPSTFLLLTSGVSGLCLLGRKRKVNGLSRCQPDQKRLCQSHSSRS